MIAIPALALVVAFGANPAFAQTVRQPQPMQQAQQAPVNPAIDMEGFLKVSLRASMHRQSRRVSEEEFARMSREPGTIVLDARSREKYDELHVKHAINLSFPDIAIESLKKIRGLRKDIARVKTIARERETAARATEKK